LLKDKEPSNPEGLALEEQQFHRQKLARLENLATILNYKLGPNQ